MITLKPEEMDDVLDQAFLLATNGTQLPPTWVARAERLGESPSVAFIAAVGAILLAKATNPAVDAYVIQAKEGSAGAFSLRSAATALAGKRHAFGYDIGSSSDKDPINHGTLVVSTRWDRALPRITKKHKPFFQVILQWLPEINQLSNDQALAALAAYIQVRLKVAPASAVAQVPLKLSQAPLLTDLIDVLDGFVAAHSQGGAGGMALVAAAFRAAGFDAGLPSRNDPRRIDIPIQRDNKLWIAVEVKQQPATEAMADTLVADTVGGGARLGLLAVVRPGALQNFDIAGVIHRAERQHGVVLRVAAGTRQVIHEAALVSTVAIDDFASQLPRKFAEALAEIRMTKDAIDTWAAMAQRW